MLRAANLAETLGMPTVSIIATGFMQQARVVMGGLGRSLALAEYPGNPALDNPEALQGKVQGRLAPAILDALTAGATPADATAEAEPAPGSVVFTGSFDAVQDYFEERLWSDGLPVVPPTRERVEAFLEFCDRDRDEVIAAVALEGREVTPLAVAICGVMAGCRPQYMPVLMAIAEAMCEPEFSVQQAGTTPGWEPLVVVNGPIAKQLDLNSGEGVMRSGRRANTAIGRFTRLFLRNLCGFRIPPGAGDKASIGQNFLVAMAENEDALKDIGWASHAQDHGFAEGENVVTVRSVVAMTPGLFSSGEAAADHGDIWADAMSQTFRSWAHMDFKHGFGAYLLVIPPCVAAIIAARWSKDELRQHIYKRALVSAGELERYARAVGNKSFSIAAQVARGIIAPRYAESNDPGRLVPMFLAPECIDIVIAGDPQRNQSKALMCNHNQGAPTRKAIRLPRHWPL